MNYRWIRLGKRLLGYASLSLLAVWTLLPFGWMVAVSLMPSGAASTYPVPLWPDAPTLAQYTALFAQFHMARYLANSLLLAGSITLGALLLNAMAGYAFAMLHFRGKDALLRLLLMALLIPMHITILPLFLMLRAVGLINTYLGVILPNLASVLGIFLMYQFMRTLPLSLIEAARMDGASEFQIFWRVALPLSRPMLVSVGMLTFLGSWNDFLWPLVVLTQHTHYTLPVSLANLAGEHIQDIELMMAGSVVTLMPVLLLFLVLQRFYIPVLFRSGLAG